MAMKQHSIPSHEEIEELLLSCRYGDLDDVKTFIDNFGTSPLNSSRDEHGNTILHMASANGHTGKS
jgi:ankyrin repeat protein